MKGPKHKGTPENLNDAAKTGPKVYTKQGTDYLYDRTLEEQGSAASWEAEHKPTSAQRKKYGVSPYVQADDENFLNLIDLYISLTTGAWFVDNYYNVWKDRDRRFPTPPPVSQEQTDLIEKWQPLHDMAYEDYQYWLGARLEAREEGRRGPCWGVFGDIAGAATGDPKSKPQYFWVEQQGMMAELYGRDGWDPSNLPQDISTDVFHNQFTAKGLEIPLEELLPGVVTKLSHYITRTKGPLGNIVEIRKGVSIESAGGTGEVADGMKIESSGLDDNSSGR